MLQWIRNHTLLLSLAIPVSVLLLFTAATGRLGESRRIEQREALHSALERCIISCYALEGFYPPDLPYMEEHYGLSYDKDLFFVDYQPVAANIRPDYYVLEFGGEAYVSR